MIRPPRARILPLERILLACVLVLIALAWWVIDDSLSEGAILWTIAPGKGLTAIDLPGVALCFEAAWLLRPGAWKRRRTIEDPCVASSQSSPETPRALSPNPARSSAR